MRLRKHRKPSGGRFECPKVFYFCLALLVSFTLFSRAVLSSEGQSAPAPALDRFGEVANFADAASAADVDRVVDKVAALGFKRVRAVIPWAEVEPERGHFTFEHYDHFLQSAQAHGMEVMLTLGFCPAWAAGEEADETPQIRRAMMPRNLEEWRHYVTAVVGRYKNHVRIWQIWERQSIENFRGTDEDYLKLLKVAHSAIRKIEPNALVFASEPGGPDLGFIAKLFRVKSIGDFDGLALSPELDRPEQLKEYVDALRGQIFAEHDNASKLIFITDWSYPFDETSAAFTTAAASPVDAVFWNESGISGPITPMEEPATSFPPDGPVCVDFQLDKETEQGLYTHKYRARRMANPITTLLNGVPAAQLTDTNPFLYFDVDDRYLFFNEGKSQIEISVRAAVRDPTRSAGFNVMYDAPAGYVFSPWTSMKPTSAWSDYSIILSNANFANKGGFDFRLSALGSRQDLYVSQVCVRRL